MRVSRQLILLALALVAACSPTLDWREYRVAEGGFSVLFPQKPGRSERALDTPAGKVTMYMYSVRVDKHVFAAGYADFPVPPASALLDALRDALVRNIGGRVDSEQAIGSGGAVGREFSATGQLGQGDDAAPAVLRARIYVRGVRFYQLVMLGPAVGIPAGDVDLFLQSFKPD